VKTLALLAMLFSPCLARADTAGAVEDRCRKFLASVEKRKGDNFTMAVTYESGFCWGAFEAAQGLLMVVLSGQEKPAFDICVDSVPRTDLIWTFLEYLRTHPEKRNDDFVLALLPALARAYRCKDGGGASGG